MMTSAQVVETSVNVTSNSPSQDYTHPDDHNLPNYNMTPGFKPFTVLLRNLLIWLNACWYLQGLNKLFLHVIHPRCFWITMICYLAIFSWILLISNHVIFLVQFGINKIHSCSLFQIALEIMWCFASWWSLMVARLSLRLFSVQVT